MVDRMYRRAHKVRISFGRAVIQIPSADGVKADEIGNSKLQFATSSKVGVGIGAVNTPLLPYLSPLAQSMCEPG